MRPLADVMEAVCNVIPDDFGSKADVVRMCEGVANSLHYTALEQARERWDEFQRILKVFLPNPHDPNSPDWTRTISRILLGSEDYRNHLPKGRGEQKGITAPPADAAIPL